jgi:anaerobic magnesium-protoporphyrin IX monomethyl ester cyclase
LGAYPFPDRMLYYHALKDRIDLSIRSLVTSRGCPMRCSFCFNDSMRGLYQGKGKYVRTRKIEKVIEEALDLKAHSQTRIITFTDDVFGVNATWLKEFLPIYRREVGLPFTCLLRADIVSRNPEIPQLLADAGCVLVSFGIESGNEEFRNSLLNKRVTDQEILASAKLLHAAGISFRTYNILGLPGETLTQAWSTVQINIDIKTDFPWCSTFMPFPGTRLTEHAVTQSFLPKDFSQDALMPSFFASSSLTNNPDMRKLENLQRFFQTLVLWPWTKPMVKRLISLPPNFLFTLWFGWVYFIVHVKAERRNLFKTLVFTAKNAKKLFV